MIHIDKDIPIPRTSAAAAASPTVKDLAQAAALQMVKGDSVHAENAYHAYQLRVALNKRGACAVVREEKGGTWRVWHNGAKRTAIVSRRPK